MSLQFISYILLHSSHFILVIYRLHTLIHEFPFMIISKIASIPKYLLLFLTFCEVRAKVLPLQSKMDSSFQAPLDAIPACFLKNFSSVCPSSTSIVIYFTLFLDYSLKPRISSLKVKQTKTKQGLPYSHCSTFCSLSYQNFFKSFEQRFTRKIKVMMMSMR